jgi:hypothetical protein
VTLTVYTWGKAVKRHESLAGPLAIKWDPDMGERIDAVVRGVERRTGLRVCGGPCPQGHDVKRDGTVMSHHYSMTLGRPVARRYGGGYSVDSELWIAIPV